MYSNQNSQIWRCIHIIQFVLLACLSSPSLTFKLSCDLEGYIRIVLEGGSTTITITLIGKSVNCFFLLTVKAKFRKFEKLKYTAMVWYGPSLCAGDAAPAQFDSKLEYKVSICLSSFFYLSLKHFLKYFVLFIR